MNNSATMPVNKDKRIEKLNSIDASLMNRPTALNISKASPKAEHIIHKQAFNKAEFTSSAIPEPKPVTATAETYNPNAYEPSGMGRFGRFMLILGIFLGTVALLVWLIILASAGTIALKITILVGALIIVILAALGIMGIVDPGDAKTAEALGQILVTLLSGFLSAL